MDGEEHWTKRNSAILLCGYLTKKRSCHRGRQNLVAVAHIACAAQLEAGGFMAWRTQREQDASLNGGTVSMSNNLNSTTIQETVTNT